MIKVSCVVTGEYQTNCYIVYDDTIKEALIIDPGTDFNKVVSSVEKLSLKPVLLINTHGHADHITCDDQIRKKFNIPLAVHKDDVDMLADSSKNFSTMISGIAIEIKNPEIIFDKEESSHTCSFCSYKIIHTSGHSQGSVCILVDDMLFSGDTLFAGSVGRTDLYGGDSFEMQQSLQKLKLLSPNTSVFPGHGPATTLKEELAHNVFLR